MEKRHADLPWEIVDSSHLWIRNINGSICTLPMPTRFPGQDARFDREFLIYKANAKFIVQACNSYAANQAKIEALMGLLRRVKETFEPFPIVSDLRSMHSMIDEAKSFSDGSKRACKAMYDKHEARNRKLYEEMEAALDEFKEKNNEES